MLDLSRRRRAVRRIFPFLISMALSSTFTTATAATTEDLVIKRDVYDLPYAVAIHGRTNTIDQSFSLSAGYILSDSFNRGLPLTLAYSFYFRPYLAWEVVSYAHNLNFETKTQQDLRNLGVDTSTIGFGGHLDFPKSIVMTGLVYTPFYGKSLLFNRKLVHSETSFYLGVGSVLFNRSGAAPAFAPGFQGRFFLSKSSALRYYLRQYLYKDPIQGMSGITEIGLGYEFQLNLFSGSAMSDAGDVDEDE